MRYEPLNESQLPGMNLGLTLWEGKYQGLEATWLRWADETGNVLLTGNERAEKLAEQLESLGVDPAV
jgi:hypothetical protein